MALGASQVQIESERIIAEPLALFDLIHKHRISYTFAPNFLLTDLVNALEDDRKIQIEDKYMQRLDELQLSEFLEYLSTKDDAQTKRQYSAPYSRHKALTIIGDELTKPWDLGCLRALISGGETNVVATCEKLTDMLQIYGAPCAFIRPGFGMTETCAGSVYSLSCPSSDLRYNLAFANLGQPIKNMSLRVMIDGRKAKPGETGRLELSGDIVFDGYYSDDTATSETFTEDGWFITWDNAQLDEDGNLHIVGRQKDIICIDGYVSQFAIEFWLT